MIAPCNFSICESTTWILDIGSPINICNSLLGLQVSRRFEKGKRFFNVRGRKSVSVLAIGIVKLIFKSNIDVLSECSLLS